MAVNDFWKRLAGEGYGDGPPPPWGPRIACDDAKAVMTDLALQTGGINTATAKLMLQITPGTSSEAEFDDLVSSALTINPANADDRQRRRKDLADVIYAACSMAERALPSNPYSTGEAIRRRVRDHINHATTGGVAQLSLGAANQ